MSSNTFAIELGKKAAVREKEALGNPAFNKEDIAPYLLGGAALGTAGAGLGYASHRIGNMVAPHQNEDARKADRNISMGLGAGMGVSPVVGDILRRLLASKGTGT